MNKEKIIMYDSPEAAEQITLTGWVSKGRDGRFFYKDEHMARWSGCTHQLCECGNIMTKGWLKCDSCRNEADRERYLKLTSIEWDGIEPVVIWNGDRFFFSEEDLIDFMTEDEEIIDEIELLICDPVNYTPIDLETIANNTCEEFEPTETLLSKIKEFNEFLTTLPAHSYIPGKIRTSYKLPEDVKNEVK